LDEYPVGCFFDEAQNGEVAKKILTEPQYRPIYVPGLTQLPALHFYVLAMWFKSFGISLLTERLLSVLLGTITIIPFYFLTRSMYGYKVAFVTTLIFTVTSWHVNFSRIAFLGIWGPLFGTTTLMFFYLGLRRNSNPCFLFAGVFLGLGTYTYYVSNLMPFILVLFFVQGLFFFRKILLRNWLGILLMIFMSMLVFIPLGYYAYHHQAEFFQRSKTVSIFNPKHRIPMPEGLWRNISTHLLMFHFNGDYNPRHNLPNAPMLDPVTGVLFLLGGIMAFTKFRTPQAALSLFWFIVMLVPGIITIESPQAYRTVGCIPAIFALIGLFLYYVSQLFDRTFPRWGGRLWWIVSIPLTLTVIGLNFDHYFHKQVKHPNAWPEFIPNIATETAMASSKLLLAAVNPMVTVFE